MLTHCCSDLGRQPKPPQQIQSPSAQSAATKDPGAVGIFNQALNAAGGSAAINVVADYSATGNITYHWNPDVEGTVTILGLGLNQIRIDANLPRGIHSSVLSNGQTTTKTEDGSIKQYPPPYPTPSSEAFPYQPPLFPGSLIFPYSQLAFALNSMSYSITDKGLVQIEGRSAHDVAVKAILPGASNSMSQYLIRDIFIDASTSQVVMTQDVSPGNIVRGVHYSDYRLVNGVAAPFSIKETVGGDETWEIQLSQITFNTVLRDASFVVQ